MNVYEYELSGMADIICDEPRQYNPDEIEWDTSTAVEPAMCENPSDNAWSHRNLANIYGQRPR